MELNAYPPEPWNLRAHAYVGLFVVPKKDLPAPHAPGTTTITLFGRGLVCAAFFVYEEPSPLTYNEIMATVLVRKGWRALVSITRIWVDSVASRNGGRELWGIPKDLADFEVAPDDSYVGFEAGTEIADLEVARVRGSIPLPVGFSVAQSLNGAYKQTHVHGRARLGVATGRWQINADGPLGYLSKRRPLLTVAVQRADLSFGSAALAQNEGSSPEAA